MDTAFCLSPNVRHPCGYFRVRLPPLDRHRFPTALLIKPHHDNTKLPSISYFEHSISSLETMGRVGREVRNQMTLYNQPQIFVFSINLRIFYPMFFYFLVVALLDHPCSRCRWDQLSTRAFLRESIGCGNIYNTDSPKGKTSSGYFASQTCVHESGFLLF